VETIGGDGELVRHRRPATPAWFRDVGLNERSRWEIVTRDPIWLVLPTAGGRARVRLLADCTLTSLSAAAAARVRELASNAIITGGGQVAPELAGQRWQALVTLAERPSGAVA
jgi:hypothetical protein